MNISLLLDVVIIALLIPTIIYAIVLNNRLASLRKHRDELIKLIASFNEATVRAEAGIPRLRKAADDAAQSLYTRVEKAQSLRDDLAFMVERADAMANRLDGVVRTARNDPRDDVAPAPRRAASAPPLTAKEPRASARPAAQKPLRADANVGSNRFAADSVADKFSFDDDRSEAEKELLRALQSSRNSGGNR
jgi:cell division septum initiation protein DivIVA